MVELSGAVHGGNHMIRDEAIEEIRERRALLLALSVGAIFFINSPETYGNLEKIRIESQRPYASFALLWLSVVVRTLVNTTGGYTLGKSLAGCYAANFVHLKVNGKKNKILKFYLFSHILSNNVHGKLYA
jgi:hypothetical protein